MLYIIPDYYKEFECIADRCEDTCCAGWQIVIDKKTLKKYRKIPGRFGKRLCRSIHWFQGTFRQDPEKRCAFLNEKNLCELYLELGEKGFCKTCREYPRHIEEFEGVREVTLSISCPEVAGIVMNRKEKVRFLSYEKEGEEEFDEFDPFLFSILEDAKAKMIEILQNRNRTIRERSVLVLGMAHDMQARMNRKELFDCFSITEKYTGEKAFEFVKKYLETKNLPEKRRSAELFGYLSQLELLRQDWGILLEETKDLLYCDEKRYQKIQKEFEEYLDSMKRSCENETDKTEKISDLPVQGKERISLTEKFDIEICLEQLLVYFLFTYFSGAVYDGEIYAKVQMAVYCVWMIWEIWMARWMKNEKILDLEEMTELVYRFSREVEHSDVNLKTIEKRMSRKLFLKK